MAARLLRRSNVFTSFNLIQSSSPHLRTSFARVPTTSYRNIATTMPPKEQAKQSEDGVSGLDEWKHRAPYAIHSDAKDFKVRYEGGCHCGRIQYQLSREKPLDAKYCHCKTCQRLHGQSLIECSLVITSDCLCRCSLPVGRHLPQRGHQLQPRSP